MIKVEVQNPGPKCATSMNTHLLQQNLENYRSKTKQISYQTNKLISTMRKEGIETLNSQLVRQTVVVWIWCHSQAAIEYIQRLYESEQLNDLLFRLANIGPSTTPKVINTDSNQFMKTVGKFL